MGLLDLDRPAADREAIRFGDRCLTYAQLSTSVNRVATALRDRERVAVLATPSVETCVAVVAALTASVTVVPINPMAGVREMEHVVSDSGPELLLAAAEAEPPAALARVPRLDVRAGPGEAPAAGAFVEPDPESTALIIYTSGTTGPPKGVRLSFRAIARNLDALASAWNWTADDVVTHALPLFHVHGLIVGVLGPLRRGGTVHHLGTFAPDRLAREITTLTRPVVVFGVPTMYHRLAIAAADDDALAAAVRQARILVSGSAGLAPRDHELIARHTDQRIVERYGMTETLMISSVRADGDRRPGIVGFALDGVEVRLVDEAGEPVLGHETIGEIEVRGQSLFSGYLNRPDATAAAFRGDWFRTGDAAVREPDGAIRIIGRRATDIIKSGGFKIGAGEIETAIADHPGVAEVAVTGEADDDLGERVVAWVVPRPGAAPSEKDIVDHVVHLLARHKRPRVVRFLERLPRNAMGKVTKNALRH